MSQTLSTIHPFLRVMMNDPLPTLSRRPALFFSLLLALCWTHSLSAADDFRSAIEGREPMSLEGVDPEVATVLQKYYSASFDGAANWEAVADFRFEGTLILLGTEFNFFGYLKKPNYSKVILYGEGGSETVMSYNGDDAWEMVPSARGPSDMPADAAVGFIRDAAVGGLLLYPNLPGKRIEALGNRRVGEFRCRDLRVTLPDGQQVTYAIDLDTGLERQKISTNSVTGQIETLTHSRWEVIQGVVILTEGTMTVAGKDVYTIQIENVEINAGLVPAMFERPPDISAGGFNRRLELEGPFKMPGLKIPAENTEDPFALPDSINLPKSQ
ncbi:MAG: hypothetical protein ACON39_01230 [Coraliomargaritaceae bacterium]